MPRQMMDDTTMPQHHHEQHGTFHLTFVSRSRIPWCTEPGVPELLIDNLRMTRSLQQAELFGFCILKDHMHVLCRPGSNGLSAFAHSFKRNSARDYNALLERRGPCWQKGFHDERIRDADQREQALSYIQWNAVHHGFVRTAEEWPWTSLHFPHLLDQWEYWYE